MPGPSGDSGGGSVPRSGCAGGGVAAAVAKQKKNEPMEVRKEEDFLPDYEEVSDMPMLISSSEDERKESKYARKRGAPSPHGTRGFRWLRTGGMLTPLPTSEISMGKVRCSREQVLDQSGSRGVVEAC